MSHHILIVDNVMTGRSTWPQTEGIEDRRAVQIAGTGAVVCYNRISHFGDAIDTFSADPCAAIAESVSAATVIASIAKLSRSGALSNSVEPFDQALKTSKPLHAVFRRCPRASPPANSVYGSPRRKSLADMADRNSALIQMLSCFG